MEHDETEAVCEEAAALIEQLWADIARLRIGDAATERRYVVVDSEAYDTHVAQNEADRKAVLQLRAALKEAADAIEDWGAYASTYFQEKHDLAGAAARFRALAGDEDVQCSATPPSSISSGPPAEDLK